jgi:flagellar protein FlgJ
MRQPDMFTAATLPLSSTAPTSATRATAPALSISASVGGTVSTASSGSFSAVFRQVQSDVGNFLSSGGGTSTLADAPALSAEGLAYLNRSRAASPLTTINGSDTPATDLQEQQQQFLAAIQSGAREAGERLGVAPELVAAHAALESGWGQRPLRQSDGSDTHNLFGIKAGGKWEGDAAASLTTEYEAGGAVKKTERFRSYPDQASAFRDYAQVLLDNPRYRSALNTGGDAHAFAQGLAKGGYATDPAYAEKLTRLAAKLQGSL